MGRHENPSAPARSAPVGHDIRSTPATAIRIASVVPKLSVSPSTTRPNSATWTGSVLDSAVMTTKFFSRMAASKRAVARIWVMAPSRVQLNHVMCSGGSGAPGDQQNERKEEQPKRQTVEEAHVGRADGAERLG